MPPGLARGGLKKRWPSSQGLSSLHHFHGYCRGGPISEPGEHFNITSCSLDVRMYGVSVDGVSLAFEMSFIIARVRGWGFASFVALAAPAAFTMNFSSSRGRHGFDLRPKIRFVMKR